VKEQAQGATERQEMTITEQRNTLRTRIWHWEPLQALYMPGLLQLHRDRERESPPDSGGNVSIQAEDIPLWLPSSLPSERMNAICYPGLASMEDKLRGAICQDALEGLRHVLRVKSRMILFKNKNVCGQ
jgi:hypothetical protein